MSCWAECIRETILPRHVVDLGQFMRSHLREIFFAFGPEADPYIRRVQNARFDNSIVSLVTMWRMQETESQLPQLRMLYVPVNILLLVNWQLSSSVLSFGLPSILQVKHFVLCLDTVRIVIDCWLLH